MPVAAYAVSVVQTIVAATTATAAAFSMLPIYSKWFPPESSNSNKCRNFFYKTIISADSGDFNKIGNDNNFVTSQNQSSGEAKSLNLEESFSVFASP